MRQNRQATRTGPDFHRLWVSSGLSNLADGTYKVALPLIAVRFTQSPTLIAGLTVTLTLPWLLFALPAGLLADRCDRRRLMLGANLTRALLVAFLVPFALLGVGSIGTLYVVAAAIGVAETIYDTAAQSILPQVVPRTQLSRANGLLYSAEVSANQFLGPPLGGVLVAVGAWLAFAAPVALWLVAVGALLLVKGQFRIERPTRTTLRADLAEGLRFLWRLRVLRALAVMTGVFNLATNAEFAVFVLYAVGPGAPMGLSAAGYGVLLAALAVGSLIGSLLAGWIERVLGRSRALVLAILGGGVLVGTPAVTHHPMAIGAVFVIGGITIVIANVITVSLRQRVTPDRLLGRVNSGYRLVGWGSMPLGAAVGGTLAQLLSLRAVFALMAVLILTLLVVVRRLTAESLDDPGDLGS